MRRALWGVCCLLMACGVAAPAEDASPSGDGSPSATRDGAAMDAASIETGITADTGVSPMNDSATSLDVATMDSGPSIDARAADARADAVADTRSSDVASLPDATRDGSAVPDSSAATDSGVRPDASGTSGVVDFTARGYYRPGGGSSTFTMGIPSGYVALPAGLTHTQLAQLQQDCVDRINQYRAGTLRFSNGTSDPGVPRTALNHLMGNDRCSSAQALGDMVVNGGAGGCAGAHSNAFSCPWTGSVGQNTCCMRTGATYADIRSQLYSCLQSMWDEGTGMPSNAAYTSANGHWYNMRSSAFTQVSCGFAFDSRGRVWMNQDFSAGRPASVAQTCSCTAAGAPDGCGATCVAGP